MNKNKIYSFIFLQLIFWMIPNPSICQKQSGWKEKNINGNIKSISKRTYRYEDGNKGKWDMDNHAYLFTSGMMHDYDIDFDKNGCILKKITYKIRISKTDSIRDQYMYEYKSNHYLDKAYQLYQNSTFKKVITYEYDSKDRLIKLDKNKGNKYGDGHYEYDYDTNGFLTQETFFNSNGDPNFKIVYKNNNHGLKEIAQRSTYNSRKRAWIKGDRNEFKYNEQQQLIELLKYLKDGRRTAKNQYEYDEFGNIKIETRFDKSDKIAFKIKYEFEYDNKNNWINCIVYKSVFNFDDPIYIVERKIEYRK